MKKFIKGRWFPLAVTGVCVLALVLILFCLGFRITYAPKLENSWDAVSAVASWVQVIISILGVIASFIAIWFAIQVPKKIADRQDKISLFEKRYECFQFFEECFALFKRSLNNNVIEEINVQCCHMLGIQNFADINQYDFANKVKRFEYLLHQMEFLFPGIQEKDVSELFNALLSYLVAILAKKDIKEEQGNYIKVMGKFGKYINEIWDSVTISNIK